MSADRRQARKHPQKGAETASGSADDGFQPDVRGGTEGEDEERGDGGPRQPAGARKDHVGPHLHTRPIGDGLEDEVSET